MQGLAQHPVGQAERGGDGGGLGLGGVSALGEELRLQALVLLHRLLAGGALAVRHPLLVLPHLAQDLVETAGREDAVTRQDLEVPGARVLGQVADLAAAGDGAAGRRPLTRQALGEGRLARAVAADQADAVALGDTEGGGLDEDAGAGTQLDAGSGDHGKTPRRYGRRRDSGFTTRRRLMHKENCHGLSLLAVSTCFSACSRRAAAPPQHLTRPGISHRTGRYSAQGRARGVQRPERRVVADAVRRRRRPGHIHGSSAQRRRWFTTGFRNGTRAAATPSADTVGDRWKTETRITSTGYA